jgi:hypothetical protein
MKSFELNLVLVEQRNQRGCAVSRLVASVSSWNRSRRMPENYSVENSKFSRKTVEKS